MTAKLQCLKRAKRAGPIVKKPRALDRNVCSIRVSRISTNCGTGPKFALTSDQFKVDIEVERKSLLTSVTQIGKTC
jgi:hypothetical protein